MKLIEVKNLKAGKHGCFDSVMDVPHIDTTQKFLFTAVPQLFLFVSLSLLLAPLQLFPLSGGQERRPPAAWEYQCLLLLLVY